MDESIKQIFVIDASYLLAFLLKENNFEVNELMKQYKSKKVSLISTTLLKFEVCNTLKTAILRKRVNKKYAQELLQAFLEYDILEENIDFLQVFKLSISKNISFYDASYLYLAKSKEIKLLTLDHSLK